MSGMYSFTLILDREPTDEEFDALFEAGLDDALFGTDVGVPYADIDRKTDSLAEAVLSAIRQIEHSTGIEVVRAEPDDLVGMADIAERIGHSTESVRLYVQGMRGPGQFPAPVTHTRERARLWRWGPVEAWFGDVLGTEVARSEDWRFLAALNGMLQVREWGRHGSASPVERELLAELLPAMVH